MLWRVGDLIDQNAPLLAELEMLNGGMYRAQAEMQVKVGAEWFRYYAGWCTKIDGIARDVNTGGSPASTRTYTPTPCASPTTWSG